MGEFEIWHQLECGCAFGMEKAKGHIVHCPRHGAADAMYAALTIAELVLRLVIIESLYPQDGIDGIDDILAHDAVLAALALADGAEGDDG